MIFVGLDLGKRAHAVCFLGADGREVARPLRVPHTGAGLRRPQEQLGRLPDPARVVMEASGAHWLGLDRRLRAAGLAVQVVNPLQTAGLRKSGIRKAKTDATDAKLVAELARVGRARSRYVPDDAVLELRELVRFRWHLADQLGDAKRRVLAVLDKVFPEFAAQLSDPFGATGRELLGRCAGAAAFAAPDVGDLAARIHRASRHQLGRAKAEALRAAAQDSPGLGCLERVARLQIRALLAQLRLPERQIAAARRGPGAAGRARGPAPADRARRAGPAGRDRAGRAGRRGALRAGRAGGRLRRVGRQRVRVGRVPGHAPAHPQARLAPPAPRALPGGLQGHRDRPRAGRLHAARAGRGQAVPGRAGRGQPQAARPRLPRAAGRAPVPADCSGGERTPGRRGGEQRGGERGSILGPPRARGRRAVTAGGRAPRACLDGRGPSATLGRWIDPPTPGRDRPSVAP
jgi:transposase